MTTISLTYNEKNKLAKKTVDFLLSLGVFKVEAYESNKKKKTLKAIKYAKENVMLQYAIHLRIILKLFQNENNFSGTKHKILNS